jgi:hypothetical protein
MVTARPSDSAGQPKVGPPGWDSPELKMKPFSIGSIKSKAMRPALILPTPSTWAEEFEKQSQIYSVEILDICGVSADYCRKCQAGDIRLQRTGRDKVAAGPNDVAIRVPCTREEIEAYARDAFAVAHDRIMEHLPEKHNQVMNQVRSTGNSGGYAHTLTKLASERVRQLILAKADAYVDAFTACRAPSDRQAEKDLQREADEFAAGSIVAVSRQSELDAGRTSRPVLPIPGIHNAMKIAEFGC